METEYIGYLVTGIITLGSFVTLVLKFIQPINDLRVVIQKLNDNIESLWDDHETLDKRIDKHGQQIDVLDNRVNKLETKMDIYHKE